MQLLYLTATDCKACFRRRVITPPRSHRVTMSSNRRCQYPWSFFASRRAIFPYRKWLFNFFNSCELPWRNRLENERRFWTKMSWRELLTDRCERNWRWEKTWVLCRSGKEDGGKRFNRLQGEWWEGFLDLVGTIGAVDHYQAVGNLHQVWCEKKCSLPNHSKLSKEGPRCRKSLRHHCIYERNHW